MKLFGSLRNPPEVEITPDVRRILHRVGAVLLSLGMLDIGVMVFCALNGISYSSSFNIFAVISAIYVWRGHPWHVKWVTRAAGFYAAAFCTMPLIAPFLLPADFAFLWLHIHPIETVAGGLATVGVLGVLIWIYRELRQAPVLAVYTSRGYSPGSIWLAPICGAALAIVIGGLVVSTMHGNNARRAIALAASKTGPGFRYVVTRLSYSNDRGAAELVAYDDESFKTVHVQW